MKIRKLLFPLLFISAVTVLVVLISIFLKSLPQLKDIKRAEYEPIRKIIERNYHSRKVEEHLLSIYERVRRKEIPMKAVFFGDYCKNSRIGFFHCFGCAFDMILYAFFTNSTPFISKTFPNMFSDVFREFLRPKNETLLKYMIYPPEDEILANILKETIISGNTCGYNMKNKNSENLNLQSLASVKPEKPEMFLGGPDFYNDGESTTMKTVDWHACRCHQCKVLMNQNSSIFFNDPWIHPDQNSFHCQYHWHGDHMKSIVLHKKRAMYMCIELGLCHNFKDSLIDFIVGYDLRKEGIKTHERMGYALMGNFLTSIFHFDGRSKVYGVYIDQIFEKVRGVLVAVHWRTVKSHKRVSVIHESLAKVINSFPRIDEFTIFFAVDYLRGKSGSEGKNKLFKSITEFVNQTENFKSKKIHFLTYENPPDSSLSKYQKSKLALLVDFNMFANSDVLICTATSSISVFATSISETYKKINPCVITKKGNVCTEVSPLNPYKRHKANLCKKNVTKCNLESKRDFPPYTYSWDKVADEYQDYLLSTTIEQRHNVFQKNN